MYGKFKFIFAPALRASLMAIASVSLLSGCTQEFADLMDDGPTATEAKIILDRSSEIRATPDASNPLPAIYRQAPEVLKTSKGWKVFYYARNHTPKDLSEIMKGQLKNSVTVADDTNQLVINCADQADVDQALAFLGSVDISPIQVKIDCIIVENYADVTMDRETRVMVGLEGDDLDKGLIITGPEQLDKSGQATDFSKYGFFPGASQRESLRKDMGMSIGYDSDDLAFLLDMLVSRGYLKVLMNPSVETINGATATISSVDQMPTTKTVTDTKRTNPDGSFKTYNVTEYIDVVDMLKITPVVYADGSVSLTCEAKLSSKNTPEGVAQLPIVTERLIKLGSTRLQPGKSLVVGGFRKAEKSSVVRGFPFLKDLPIIGTIFSSRDFEERSKEITFILTPSVSTNGIPYSEMLEEMAARQFTEADPNDIKSAINKALTDPFGRSAYTDEMIRNRESDAIQRLRAEIESAETQIEADNARRRLEAYRSKLQREQQLTEKASEQSRQQQQKIAEMEAAIEELKKETQRRKAEYEESLDEIRKNVKTTEQQAGELVEQSQKAKEQLDKREADLEKTLRQKQQLEAEKQQLIDIQSKLNRQIEETKAEISKEESKIEQSDRQQPAGDTPPADESKEAQDAQ
jgi:Flp pilus assembly secretin CpaC